MAVGKNIIMKKRERRSNIIFSVKLWLLGRISSGEEGDGNFGKENQDIKNRVGKNIQL